MPYAFADTTTQSPVAEEMPAEALKLNGSYIENLINANNAVYRTLYVKGRESLVPEINSFETGVRDGSSILSKRFPAREITIGYKLQAAGNAYFRFAYNQLASILNVQDAELIFYDEQDKFFIGTPQGLDEVEPGRNFVIGEFTILCADPFKYSVKEYEIDPTEDNGSTFVLDYEGTYKSFPTLEADFKGDCGFAAWFSQDAKVIQIGDSDEEEGEEYQRSDTLVSQDWSEDASLSDWSIGTGNIWIVPSGSSYGVGGSLTTDSDSNGRFVKGTFGSTPGGWGGASGTQRLSEKATEWTLQWSQTLSIGDGGGANTTRGGIQVIVTDSDLNIIAAANMFKGSGDSGNTGNIWLHAANTVDKKTGIDFSRNNSRWGSKGSCSMTKSGSTVNFNIGGSKYSLTDSNIASMEAYRVTFVFLQLSDYAHCLQGIYSIKFKKDNVTAWRDIPNKFGKGDVVTVECGSGTIKFNDAEAPEYGALGNDWEEFYLAPGYNQIGFSYSDWVTAKPTTKLRYREVFI